MLTLNHPQMRALRQGVSRRFEDGFLEHTDTYFRNHRRVLGEAGLRSVVRLGTERARRHGFGTERELYLYLSVMLYLGSHFDADVQLPWARRILADPTIVSTRERSERLFDASLDYMRRVYGAANEHLDEALERITHLVRNDAFGTTPLRGVADLQMGLRWVFRSKYDEIGPAVLDRLVRHCIDKARAHRIDTQRGVALYLGLVFLLGQEVDVDPQFDWVACSLAEDPTESADCRVTRLYEAARAQLALWLA